MKKPAIIIHGGAGPDSEFIRAHKKEYEKGLADAIHEGYEVLKKRGTAVDAVFAAVKCMEDNPIFNCGRGSAINTLGEIEMHAAIMDGKTKKCGAAAVIKNVKNPVALAKSIMLNSKYIYLGGNGALNYAKQAKIDLEPDAYFVTEHQFDAFNKKRKESLESNSGLAAERLNAAFHGTVGAVAVDYEGNIAAATSTGGTEYCKDGRIGDASMIGVGTYADNAFCAVSCTGDGEDIIENVVAHSLLSWMKHKGKTVKQACREVIKEHKGKGDLGVIAIDTKGNIGVECNTVHMHRAWKTGTDKAIIKIYT